MLEAACHNIATWYVFICILVLFFLLSHDAKHRQDPSPGGTLELGFLGSVIHVEIPDSSDAQQLTETSSFNERYDPRNHVSP